jgi:hypothetical protein
MVISIFKLFFNVVNKSSQSIPGLLRFNYTNILKVSQRLKSAHKASSRLFFSSKPSNTHMSHSAYAKSLALVNWTLSG